MLELVNKELVLVESVTRIHPEIEGPLRKPAEGFLKRLMKPLEAAFRVIGEQEIGYLSLPYPPEERPDINQLALSRKRPTALNSGERRQISEGAQYGLRRIPRNT